MDCINFSELKNKTISFIGISKNAGKTTAFNYILRNAIKEGIVAGITSIGRDGEKIDIVTKTDKPEIFVEKGTIFATASKLLAKSDVTKMIIASTGFNTPMGEVYIARAESSGFVEIGGPSMVSQLNIIKEKMFELGAETVLIDGAADRRSLGFATVADKVVLCAGAAFSRDIAESIDITVFVAGLFELPVVDCTLKTEEDYIIINGAVLDSSAEEIIRLMNESGKSKIVFDDPSKILCSPINFTKLKRHGAEIYFEKKPDLLCVAINPTSPFGYEYNEQIFKTELEKYVKVPVVNFGRTGYGR